MHSSFRGKLSRPKARPKSPARRKRSYRNKKKKINRSSPSKRARAKSRRVKHETCLRKIFRDELKQFPLAKRNPGIPRLRIDDPRATTVVHAFMRKLSKFMAISKSQLRNLLYRQNGVLPMEVRRLFIRKIARCFLEALPRRFYLRKWGPQQPRPSRNPTWGLYGPLRATRRVLNKVGIKPPKRKSAL